MTTTRDGKPFAALVYNPIKVDGSDLRATVISASHRAGWGSPMFAETTVDDPGQDATRRVLGAGASAVLVAGGDGTVRCVAEVTAGSGVPLTVVPSGTGNILARNVQLPLSDAAKVVATAFDGDEMSLDIGRALVVRPDGTEEEHAFVVMAGIGLDAAMIHNTNSMLKKRVGWVAYLDGAARAVSKAVPFRIMYQLDDERLVNARAHSLLWANCGQLPAGIALLPDARIDDGVLDIAVFQPRRWWEWAAVWRTVWWKNSVLRRSPAGRKVVERMGATGAVRFMQGVSLDAAVAEPQPIELDGDAFGEALRVRGWIERGTLLVTVPRGHRIDPSKPSPIF